MDLARALTDEHVLRAFMRARRLTRAELAAQTGISRPTAGESVRRLTECGLVVDTGERTPGGRGRGRVGSYYALAPDAGTAFAVAIAPEGVTAQLVDALGDTVCSSDATLPPPGPAPRLAVVSVADPVDRATGRVVRLPDAPFLVGELDPVGLLAPHVAGPVTVDNDVNWAARAERAHTGLADFAYLYLGEGLGCALVADGEVRRGRNGLAGEVAHLLTAGPDGAATPFIEVFGRLGLRRRGTTAIDVPRLLAAPAAAPAIATAVAGVVAALVALADPGVVVIGGPWGPALLNAIGPAVAALPRRVELRPAAVADGAPLAGARAEAVALLQAAVVADAQGRSG